MDNADIRELATAAWRLEKWLDNLNAERKMAAKSALRSIKKYIAACNVEVKDPIGSKFDPGLAVEVVNNEAPEIAEEDLIIVETLAPYIYVEGELAQYARVIIGSQIKEAKPNNEIKAETTGTPETITPVTPKKQPQKKKKPGNKSKKKKKKRKNAKR